MDGYYPVRGAVIGQKQPLRSACVEPMLSGLWPKSVIQNSPKNQFLHKLTVSEAGDKFRKTADFKNQDIIIRFFMSFNTSSRGVRFSILRPSSAKIKSASVKGIINP